MVSAQKGGYGMILTRFLLVGLAVLLCGMPPAVKAADARNTEIIMVIGAAGTADYERLFRTQAEGWQKAASSAGVSLQLIGQEGKGDNDLASLETALKTAAAKPDGQLWLVFIGHGTYDGREPKFNLRGPDLSSSQLAAWLKPLKRELVFIHTSSASGGFLQPLTGPGRIIVTATQNADEVFYARFGEHFAPAIGGLPEADLDHDGQTSVLEAFLYSSAQATRYYENEERLATEHALLEDNGDGMGTRAEVFEGVKATVPKADGQRAAQVALVLSADEQKLTDAQRSQRDELERELETLKSRRAEMAEDAYYTALEKVLRRMGEIYR